MLSSRLICMLLLSFSAVSQAFAADPPPGLFVRDGVLMKGASPYRGIGVNYFNLFARVLAKADDSSSLEGLDALARLKIPFVRFMCGGFWPIDQKLYLTDREEYFRRLDRVVRRAEQDGIGLIPSLFWNCATVSDIVAEPLDELGNPQSKSIAFIRGYTAEIVTRYKDSPAVWGWEFGNEYNLAVDLPNASEHRPPTWPQLGTPNSRSARDELKFPQLHTAFFAFADTARKIDPHRILLSGNAIPRTSAWHNANEKSWTQDTDSQFAEILLRDNPAPMDGICVHLYRDAKGAYPGGAKSIDEALGLTAGHARKAGKPLFLGEFGAERQLGPPERQRAVFDEFLAAIDKHNVPLAAFWVFDLDGQESDWNISMHNDRAFMLDMVVKANARLASAARRASGVASPTPSFDNN